MIIESVKQLKEILNKINTKSIDVSKVKFQWHSASYTEPLMSSDDYEQLKNDIKLVGSILEPVVIYDNKIVDGRHRQKVAIELKIPMSVKIIPKDYKIKEEILMEFVISTHSKRNKSNVQKQIQAFKYKRTIANVTWDMAAKRFGVNARTIRKLTKIYNLLLELGNTEDFDKILTKFEMNVVLTPKDLHWLKKPTGTIDGVLKQLKSYCENITNINDNVINNIDPTEEKIESNTGEVIQINKKDNIFNNITFEEIEQNVKKISEQLKMLDNNKRKQIFKKYLLSLVNN